MQRYIEQLLEDLMEAKERKPILTDSISLGNYNNHDGPNENDFSYCEVWNQAQLPMGQWFEIEKIVFPPAQKLNTQQTTQLVKGITDLWNAYNFIPDYPEDLPDSLKYKLLVGNWEEKTPFAQHGHWHIEFCDYNSETCPFGSEFCQCKDWFDEEGIF